MLTVDSYPTAESPFDSGGHAIAQFIRSLQCSFSFYADNPDLASSDLSSRFVLTSYGLQAALVAGRSWAFEADRRLQHQPDAENPNVHPASTRAD